MSMTELTFPRLATLLTAATLAFALPSGASAGEAKAAAGSDPFSFFQNPGQEQAKATKPVARKAAKLKPKKVQPVRTTLRKPVKAVAKVKDDGRIEDAGAFAFRV